MATKAERDRLIAASNGLLVTGDHRRKAEHAKRLELLTRDDERQRAARKRQSDRAAARRQHDPIAERRRAERALIKREHLAESGATGWQHHGG